jgi:hypothetical protein
MGYKARKTGVFMSDERNHQQNQAPDGHQPAILLPAVMTALLGLMLAVHLARAFVS